MYIMNSAVDQLKKNYLKSHVVRMPLLLLNGHLPYSHINEVAVDVYPQLGQQKV